VLNDAGVDGASEVGVVVGDYACFVADVIVHVLHKLQMFERKGYCLRTNLEASLPKKLVASFERNLNDAGEFGHLLRGVVLDVCDALGELNYL
jgi:hypothetical protein